MFLIDHILSAERGGDYEEMLLHDTVTCFLFFGFLFSNFLPVGTMIIILHDACDVLVHIAKAMNVSIFTDYAPIPFVGMQLIWLWMRLICLPIIIWSITEHGYPEDRAQFDPFINLNIVFLSTLLAMHVIWFIMFQRVNMTILRKKEVDEQLYNCATTIEVADAKIQDISSPQIKSFNSMAGSSAFEDSPREHSD